LAASLSGRTAVNGPRFFLDSAIIDCPGDSKRVHYLAYIYALLKAGIAAVGTGILAIAARFLAASIVALIWAGAADAQTAEKRVALVIGNGQYTRPALKLENPTNDAQDIAQALREIGFDVMLYTDIGKSKFDQALGDFARKARNADTALLYYAGHGLQRGGRNYFLPIDIDPRDEFDFDFLAIKQDSVLDAVSQAKSVKIVILDACRDNPLAKQIVASRSWGGGLARIDAAEEMVIAYAAASGRLAFDGDRRRNSPFAAALVKRIKEPGLEINTMFRRVANDVYEETKGGQHPEFSSSLRTDYYLNSGESDSEAWNKVRESTSPADFKEFIRKFHDSPFAREAQFRIDLFDRIRRENEEARQEAERRQREADRLREEELKKQEAERLAREAERKRAEEQKRQEEARLAREAELKRQDYDRRAREAEKKREEELKTQEAERLFIEAENKRKDDEARKKAEREREDAQRKVAALEQEEHKKQLEREQQGQICESDQRKLDEFAAGLRAAEIEQLGKDTACRSLQPAVAAATKKAAKEMKQVCEQERKSLAALKDNDIESLKASVGQMKCEAAREKGQERIAKVEFQNKRMQAICSDETAKLHAIDDTAPQARETLAGLLRSECREVRAEADGLTKKIDARVREAQNRLADLGCYKGAANGKFDDATIKSLTLYHTKKGSTETGDHISDGLVSELKAQQIIVCPAPIIAMPTPEPPKEVVPPEHKQPKIEKVSHEEEEAPPAVQPKKHKKHVAAHEEEPGPPPPKPRKHIAVHEEEPPPPPHHRAEPPPPRHHKVEAPARPRRAARVWQPPAFVGPSAASHGSPSVTIGVGN
jgi:hypothetical protein